jgi:hypothetical protein
MINKLVKDGFRDQSLTTKTDYYQLDAQRFLRDSWLIMKKRKLKKWISGSGCVESIRIRREKQKEYSKNYRNRKIISELGIALSN